VLVKALTRDEMAQGGLGRQVLGGQIANLLLMVKETIYIQSGFQKQTFFCDGQLIMTKASTKSELHVIDKQGGENESRHEQVD
jgi:hypothetical protein